MADDTLSWTLQLRDQVSGPAQRAQRSLRGVQQALRSAQRTPGVSRADMLGAGGRFDSLARDARALGGRFARENRRRGAGGVSPIHAMHLAEFGERNIGRAIGLMSSLGSAALEVASAVGSIGVAFGRSVVEQAAFREGTLTTMRTILGSEGAAREEFNQAIRFARETPLDVGEVIGIRRNLVSAGFRNAHDRDILTALTTDIAALNPGDSSVGERLGVALSQIHAAGRLRGSELLQLTNAGVSRSGIFAALGEQLHLRGSAQQINRQVEQRMQHGQITDAMALRAIVTSVERLTGGQVGTLSRAQSETLTGRISNFRGLWQELLVSQDIERSSGVTAFSGAIGNFNNLMNAGAPLGREFMGVIRQLSDTTLGGIFRDFEGAKGAARLEGILRDVLSLTRSIAAGVSNVMNNILRPLAGGAWDALREQLPALERGIAGFGKQDPEQFRAVGSALGTIVGWLARLGIAIGQFSWGNIGAVGGYLNSAAKQLEQMREAFNRGGWGIAEAIFMGFRAYFMSTPGAWFLGQTLGASLDSLSSLVGLGPASAPAAPTGQLAAQTTKSTRIDQLTVQVVPQEGADPQQQGQQAGEAIAGALRGSSEG